MGEAAARSEVRVQATAQCGCQPGVQVDGLDTVPVRACQVTILLLLVQILLLLMKWHCRGLGTRFGAYEGLQGIGD